MPVADCTPDEPPCNRDANGIGDCVVNLFFCIEEVWFVIVNENFWVDRFPSNKIAPPIRKTLGDQLNET